MAAMTDYGTVLTAPARDAGLRLVMLDCEWEHEHVSHSRWDLRVDVPSSDALRARLLAERAQRGEPRFFDRGPGYATLSGGATSSPLDEL